MKRVIIIQARMTSTRLPGKVLMDLCGQPMLARQLERLRRCRNVDEICVATTTNDADDAIVELARRLDVAWFRGDEQDVLGRYLGAARETRAELVVRVTSDCPLIDPEVSDQVIAAAYEPDARCDYASNTVERTYPRGLDTEAFYLDALVRADRLATSVPAREHVTWFIHRERPELFLRRQVRDVADHSRLRWTVDTPEDLAFARAIYDHLGDREVSYRELVAWVVEHPEVTALNAHVEQKAQ